MADIRANEISIGIDVNKTANDTITLHILHAIDMWYSDQAKIVASARLTREQTEGLIALLQERLAMTEPGPVRMVLD